MTPSAPNRATAPSSATCGRSRTRPAPNGTRKSSRRPPPCSLPRGSTGAPCATWIKQAHVWATLDNRHYDIEAIEGVDNPFDLNDIRRGLVEDLSEKHPDLFARISDHPWWQDALAMTKRTNEAIAALGEEADDEEASPKP